MGHVCTPCLSPHNSASPLASSPSGMRQAEGQPEEAASPAQSCPGCHSFPGTDQCLNPTWSSQVPGCQRPGLPPRGFLWLRMSPMADNTTDVLLSICHLRCLSQPGAHPPASSTWVCLFHGCFVLCVCVFIFTLHTISERLGCPKTPS